jgi:hypothetical protein
MKSVSSLKSSRYLAIAHGASHRATNLQF